MHYIHTRNAVNIILNHGYRAWAIAVIQSSIGFIQLFVRQQSDNTLRFFHLNSFVQTFENK